MLGGCATFVEILCGAFRGCFLVLSISKFSFYMEPFTSKFTSSLPLVFQIVFLFSKRLFFNI